MLRVAICDDDRALCQSIERIVLGAVSVHGGDVDTEAFFSGEDLCDYMQQGHYFDVIFLDIEMGKLDGVSAGRRIREVLGDEDAQIIYISAKDSYAMALFAVRPMNFLIKPISEEQVLQVLKQANHLLNKDNAMYEYKINRQSYFIAFKKIQYFEAANRQVIIHLKDGQETYYGRLAEVIEKTRRQRFLQISRSELVNYDAIEAYRREKVKLYGGKELLIGRSRQKQVQEQMLLYAEEDM